jgi:uncharacterized membrane protein YkoI
MATMMRGGGGLNKRWKWTAGACAILVTAGLAIFLIGNPWMSTTQALSRESVEKNILEQYAGEVTSSVLTDGVYVMSLRTQRGIYELKVDAHSGEIISLKRMKAFIPLNEPSPSTRATSVKLDPLVMAPNKQFSQNPKESPIISSKDAAAAASQHVLGRVKDIELRQLGDRSYYVVEIETANKEKGYRKADVQVNAITGAVTSVIWEARHNDDDHLDTDKRQNDDDNDSDSK